MIQGGLLQPYTKTENRGHFHFEKVKFLYIAVNVENCVRGIITLFWLLCMSHENFLRQQ